MPDQKKRPEPIENALAAIGEFEAQNSVSADSADKHEELLKLLKKYLPSLAMRMKGAGEDVSSAKLLSHIGKGQAHIQNLITQYSKRPASQKQQQKRNYDEIVARLEITGPPVEVSLNDPLEVSLNDPLMDAATKGDIKAFKRLHKAGMDIRAELDNALRLSAMYGHLAIVKYLRKHGVNIQVNTNVALRVAVGQGHVNVVKYLRKHGVDIKNSCSIACSAASGGHIDMIKYLRKHGVNILAKYGDSLRSAAVSGHIDMIKYLHKHGANISVDNDRALRSAAICGHMNIVKYLRKHGADIRANNDEAIRGAAESGRLDMVKYLRKHGADIRANNDEAIRKAAERGHVDMVEYLHKHGADISANDEALSNIEKNNRFEVMDYLFEEKIVHETFFDNYQPYKNWINIHGKEHKDLAARLYELNPYFFKPKSFSAVKAMLEKEGYTGKERDTYAYHISGLFSSEDRVLRYLETWGKAGKQPLHDCCHKIKLPNSGRPDLKAWGDAVLQHGPKLAPYTNYSDHLARPEKDDAGAGWSYMKTKEKIAEFAFDRAAEQPELAFFCLDRGWNNSDFEDILEQIDIYNAQYGAPDTQETKGFVPDVKIDGTEFGKPGYHFYKLADGDPRGLILGEFTNCCQHLQGAGADCARHGYISKDGGFYVVAEKRTDKIVGQSWAWRGTNDELVLDSLESLSGHFNAKTWTKLSNTFSKKVKAINKKTAKTDTEEPARASITAVHIGTGGNTPNGLNFPIAETPATPIDYNDYRDSDTQYLVAKL